MRNCDFCGKPSGTSHLCADCFRQYKSAIIDVCENCGTWLAPFSSRCPKCNTKINYKKADTIIPAEEQEETKLCPVCGTEISEDKTVCRDCWNKGKRYYNSTKRQNIDYREEYEWLCSNIETEQETIEELANNAIALYYDEDDTELLDNLEEDIEEIREMETDEEISSSCVICGAEANGYWFCPNCYREYKNKEITIKFTRCVDTTVLDAGYENTLICDDGHRVKSKTEQAIDNWLYNHKIWHVYEKEYRYGSNRDEIIHPDFYLPEYDLYIEHWGKVDDYHYRQQMDFKLEIYRKKRDTLICTYEDRDGKNIHSALEYYLKNYKKGKINFEE